MNRTNEAKVTSETALLAAQVLARLGDNPMAIGAAGAADNMTLPPHVADTIRQVLVNLAAGRDVAVSERREELTPNEAAVFLNVSRPYVVKLLDEGVLPFREVGTHKRIPYADLAAYKQEQRARSRVAMTELVRLSQEMGLYDDPQPMPPKSDYRIPAERNT
jgi:excisionase family DNA binding protein